MKVGDIICYNGYPSFYGIIVPSAQKDPRKTHFYRVLWFKGGATVWFPKTLTRLISSVL